MNFEKMLSERIGNIKESASMSINEKTLVLKRNGGEIINLSIGEPDFDTPEEVKEAGIQAIKDNYTHYTDSKGIPELREAVSKKLKKDNGIISEPEKNVLITPGTKQALYYANCCLINPGDEAIIFEPYWVTYADSLKLCGGVPVFAAAEEKNGFKLKAEQIKSKITRKTRYVLFSNPCNPTGALWNKEELEEIVEIARENNILIISDEIYEKLVFDGNKFVSTASLKGAEEITITLNGLSKSHAMTGWRIGYAVAHPALIKAMTKVQQQTATCVSSISQKAAVKAFESENETKRMADLYQKRRDLLVSGLNKIRGFECRKPEGTFYAFPGISGLGMKSVEATEYILENCGISVVPGIAYGENFDSYLRLSFAVGEEDINKALEKLEKVFGKK